MTGAPRVFVALRSVLLSSVFVAFAAALSFQIGCGDASGPSAPPERAETQNITAPTPEKAKAKDSKPETPPPSPDAGPTSNFRDPTASDGGCSAPNKVCGGKCVSISNEVGHCGDCNRACTGPGAICNAGSCACSAIGFAYCVGLGGCIDVSSNNANCGACGVACNGNQTCQNGQCTDNM